jgi:hypothetical protein
MQFGKGIKIESPVSAKIQENAPGLERAFSFNSWIFPYSVRH